MNVRTLRKLRRNEKWNHCRASTWWHPLKRDPDPTWQRVREKNAFHMRSIFHIDSLLFLCSSNRYSSFLYFAIFFFSHLKEEEEKEEWRAKKSTRKYGFLALMRNIFPFQHSIPGNCKKVETRRMFDIGKERCQSFVNIKILRVCVHGLIFILMFNPNLFAVQVQLSIMLELSWRITKLKEKRSVLLSI